MPDALTIDFETRSPLDLKAVGIYRYTEDPRTEVLCFHANYKGKGHTSFSMDVFDMPDWLYDALADDDVPVHAHNATVERLVIKRIGEARYGWPRVKAKRFRCSAARARRLALPAALDQCGAALGVAVQKDKDGKRVMMRLARPIKHSPDGYIYDNDPRKLERLGEYCRTDVLSEMDVEDETFPLTDEELHYYQLTERINDRGVKVDVRLVRQLIWRANECMEELNERIRRMTGGAVEALTNVAQLKQWVYDETGVTLHTLRKEDMEGLLDEAAANALPERIIRVLRIRQEGAKSSVAKLLSILNRVSLDGNLHGAFVYHGASTGRYTSMGVQLQNLVRDTLKDFDKDIKRLKEFTLEEISKSIRGCFIPKDGHVFIDADYNAIEARGVGWLAGAKRLLKIYQTGGDPYCEMGTVIYGFTVTKANERERFVGKQTILGCGYGMGPPKFEAQCIKLTGQGVGIKTAEKAVFSYRDEFEEIPQLWRDIEAAAIRAVKRPGTTTEIPNGLIKFRVSNGYLQMKLPSGRRLFYKSPMLRQKHTPWGKAVDELTYMAVNGTTKQWVRESTWGGKLTENAVQAISRDLLFEAMSRLERWGIDVVLSIHDQIVAQVPKIDAEWAKKKVQEAMEYLPEWARGFPVKAEPKITLRFGK